MKKQLYLFFLSASFMVIGCSKDSSGPKPDSQPVINYTVDKYHLHLNEPISVDNTSTGGESIWSFSDGTTYEGKNPIKSFETPGEYGVTLKVGNTEKTFKVKVGEGESSFVVQSGTTTSISNMWYKINRTVNDFGDLPGGTIRDTVYTSAGTLSLGWIADNRRYTIDETVELKKFETSTFTIKPSTTFSSRPL